MCSSCVIFLAVGVRGQSANMLIALSPPLSLCLYSLVSSLFFSFSFFLFSFFDDSHNNSIFTLFFKLIKGSSFIVAVPLCTVSMNTEQVFFHVICFYTFFQHKRKPINIFLLVSTFNKAGVKDPISQSSDVPPPKPAHSLPKLGPFDNNINDNNNNNNKQTNKKTLMIDINNRMVWI